MIEVSNTSGADPRALWSRHPLSLTKLASVALVLSLGACIDLLLPPDDESAAHFVHRDASAHRGRVDAGRDDAGRDDDAGTKPCEVPAGPGPGIDSSREGEAGEAISIGPEGQTPADAVTPAGNATCACDRATPPPDLRAFIGCFSTDLRKWGIDIKLDGDVVLAKDGKRYTRHTFENEFAAAVYIEVKDIERADIILRSYDKYLRPLLLRDRTLREAMQWWILRYYRFFAPSTGTIDEYVYDYPAQLTLYQNLSAFYRGGKYYPAFKAFIEQIAHQYAVLAPAHASGGGQVIRIVTGPYGGGHTSVANTLSLALADKYDVATIDECRGFSGALDTITQNLYRNCLIFNDIEITEGDLDKSKMLSHLNWLLSYYIVPDQRGALRRQLRAEHTDLVISAVHHIPDITSVGTALGRPTLIAVTDFSFLAGQYFDINHVQARLVQYLIPTIQRNFFRPMMLDYYEKSWEARVGSARTAYIHDQLFGANGATELSAEMLAHLEVFNLLGFPVNPAMHPPANAAEIIAARTALKLGTNPERKIIAVAFGSTVQPERTLYLLSQALPRTQEVDYPIEIALVSGGNTEVIEGATALFQQYGIRLDDGSESADNPYPDHTTAVVFPRLTQEEIAELYRATDAYVSKAGGATTAELIASSTQFVRGFGLWEWEYENALWLGKLGLSRENPVEPADPLRLDTSFLGRDPMAAKLVSEVNQTLALPRLFTLVPGALAFDEATLEGIVDPLLALPSTVAAAPAM